MRICSTPQLGILGAELEEVGGRLDDATYCQAGRARAVEAGREFQHFRVELDRFPPRQPFDAAVAFVLVAPEAGVEGARKVGNEAERPSGAQDLVEVIGLVHQRAGQLLARVIERVTRGDVRLPLRQRAIDDHQSRSPLEVAVDPVVVVQER
jgi:hypothetical protein